MNQDFLLQKRTKVVATIGPASESEEQIAALIRAGLNIARFNTKHNEPAWHQATIQKVRKVASELGAPVAILLDLQGPEVRITLPNTPSFTAKKGEKILFTSNEKPSETNAVFIPQEVIESLNVGNEISLADGAVELVVVEKKGNTLMVEAVDNCTIATRKTMNTPGTVLNMPSLLPKDLTYIDAAKAEGVEYVGLSFVRDAHDIEILRGELKKRNMTSDIIAKIENQKAVENLDELIAVSDAVMVARGDLGVEIAFEEVPFLQKKIITSCRAGGKPVITATQMLLSMMDKPRPTRAEVSDVANAVYDGTDAVMLSEESAMGKFSMKAVGTHTRITKFYEQHPFEYMPKIKVDAAVQKLVDHAAKAGVEKVILVEPKLHFVRQLSALRTSLHIFAFVQDEQMAHKLNLSYGVVPVLADTKKVADAETAVVYLKANNLVAVGEKVLFVYNGENKGKSATQPTSFEVK